MRSGSAVFLFVFSAVLLPSLAYAQEEGDEAAVEHFRLGQEYLADNRFEDALREFRDAHRLSGRAEMIFNEAVALEKLQRWGEAADAYERFVDAVPEDHSAREGAVSRAQEMRRREASEPATEMVEPVTLQPVRVASPSPLTLPGVVVLGVSALIGASSLVTGLIAHGTYSDLETQCVDDICPASLRDDRDTASSFASVSTVLFVTAVVGGVLGGTLMALGLAGVGADDGEGASAAIVPFGAPGGGGLTVTGSF